MRKLGLLLLLRRAPCENTMKERREDKRKRNKVLPHKSLGVSWPCLFSLFPSLPFFTLSLIKALILIPRQK